MDQKNTWWIIGVIVVLLVLGGAWFLFSSPAQEEAMQNTDTGQTQNQDQGQNTSAPVTSNLRTVTSQGGNYTCSLNTLTAAGQTTGTVFGSGGKTRLDFQFVATDGTRVTTHTIRSGTTAYTWVDGQSVGVKSAITASSPIVPQPAGGVSTISDNVNISSDCHPWVPDATQFAPPSSITFTAA